MLKETSRKKLYEMLTHESCNEIPLRGLLHYLLNNFDDFEILDIEKFIKKFKNHLYDLKTQKKVENAFPPLKGKNWGYFKNYFINEIHSHHFNIKKTSFKKYNITRRLSRQARESLLNVLNTSNKMRVRDFLKNPLTCDERMELSNNNPKLLLEDGSNLIIIEPVFTYYYQLRINILFSGYDYGRCHLITSNITRINKILNKGVKK